MRLASILAFAAILATASGARAENWVHTRDNGGGLPMCFDKESIKLGSDGLTRYTVKMCKDTGGQWYAVDCTKNWKVELLVRIYDRGTFERYREMTVDDMQSGMAVDAAMACNK